MIQLPMHHRSRVAACLLAIALVGIPAVARAQAQNGGTPGEWLMSSSSARTLGLGGAYVALADDPLGVLWNPAGLSRMDQNEVRVEHAALFEGTSFNGAGFAVPGSRFPSLGVLVLSQRSGDIERTNELNDNLGTFHDGETAYLFTASRALSPRAAVGASFKFVQQTVEDFSANGMGADLGATFAATPSLQVAASLVNIGGPTHTLRDVAERYPLLARAGLAATLLQGRGIVSLQLDHADGPGTTLHVGGEYWIQPGIAVRMGVDRSEPAGGLSYRFLPQYQFDYAASNGPLGLEHRVGLSYRFSGFFASSNAEPRVFSPTGESAVTRFALNSRTKSDPSEWSLDLRNKADEVVRRFGGKGQPPSHIEWDGKDEAGMPLPDGMYRYRLVVKDLAGRVVDSPEQSVSIATTGPQGSVPVLPVN